MLREIIISMRPKQWYKNLIIFIGLFFSLNVLNFSLWINSISAFIIFCLLSGSSYIINDILDIENDRKHPKKRNRPLASGKLKPYQGIISVVICLLIALIWAFTINVAFFVISIVFLLLIMSYSLYFKKFIIVDIIILASGFVIRAVAGALAITVTVSPWLVICAFLLALFLALGKRRHELTLLGDKAREHRENLKGFSTEMLDQMIIITTSTLIMSYSLYTFTSGKESLMITIPFAFYGLFRYIFLIHSENIGGEPEMLFKDKGMLLSIILWVLVVLLVLYVNIGGLIHVK